MIYAGIGARETPPEILSQMTQIAEELGAAGWHLRSGAAHGADTAFEEGCDQARGGKTIFLPWFGYNDRARDDTPGRTVFSYAVSINIAFKAEEHHPGWQNLKLGARKLMYRNAQIVLGYLANEPVDMVICWTKGGCAVGGTGHAIRIANHYDIPVFNLFHENAMDDLVRFVTDRS